MGLVLRVHLTLYVVLYVVGLVLSDKGSQGLMSEPGIVTGKCPKRTICGPDGSALCTRKPCRGLSTATRARDASAGYCVVWRRFRGMSFNVDAQFLQKATFRSVLADVTAVSFTIIGDQIALSWPLHG